MFLVFCIESACNAGDPCSLLGLGRSPGEGIGYPFQYSSASLLSQTVKNLPAMQETWVRSWVGKIPWRRAWQPTPVFLPRESPALPSLSLYIYLSIWLKISGDSQADFWSLFSDQLPPFRYPSLQVLASAAPKSVLSSVKLPYFARVSNSSTMA